MIVILNVAGQWFALSVLAAMQRCPPARTLCAWAHRRVPEEVKVAVLWMIMPALARQQSLCRLGCFCIRSAAAAAAMLPRRTAHCVLCGMLNVPAVELQCPKTCTHHSIRYDGHISCPVLPQRCLGNEVEAVQSELHLC